jgi:hypothetical protein
VGERREEGEREPDFVYLCVFVRGSPGREFYEDRRWIFFFLLAFRRPSDLFSTPVGNSRVKEEAGLRHTVVN